MDVDQILHIIGAAVSLASVLAGVLPRRWALTRVLARLSIDLVGFAKHGAPYEGR